jgi:hypothetical protein
MNSDNEARTITYRPQGGYTPKGYVTQIINGKTVKIPVSELTLIPPTSGTAAVTPKKQQAD